MLPGSPGGWFRESGDQASRFAWDRVVPERQENVMLTRTEGLLHTHPLCWCPEPRGLVLGSGRVLSWRCAPGEGAGASFPPGRAHSLPAPCHGQTPDLSGLPSVGKAGHPLMGFITKAVCRHSRGGGPLQEETL